MSHLPPKLKVDFTGAPRSKSGKETEMQAVIAFPDIPNGIPIPLFGLDFTLRFYALAYMAGLIAGWRIIVALMRRPQLWPAGTAPMEPRRVEDLLTAIVIGVIVGGRLGYVLFYSPGHYLANPLDIPKVWQGGMSFHGGFLGVIAAGLWFCRRHGVPAMQLSDAMALVAPVGLFLGRIANFINAELWGRPSDAPWAVIFPGEAAQDCAGIAAGACARHPSQLYEAALEGLLLLLLLTVLAFRRGWLKKPGAIMGLFLIGYGFARFLVEFVRQPDVQFISEGNPLGLALHIGGYGLTMGQLLTLPMLAAGLWFTFRARKA